MKYLLLLLFILGFFGGALGQDKKDKVLDSLRNELLKTKHDSNKWKINYEIADIQGGINLDSAMMYMYKCVELSKKSEERRADTYRVLAVLHAKQNIHLDSCKYYAILAKKKYQSRQDTTGIIKCIVVLSTLETKAGRYDKSIESLYNGIRLVDENSQNNTDNFIRLKTTLIEELIKIYFKQENYSKMITTYGEQLELLEKIKEINIWEDYMTAYIGLGMAHLSLGKLDSAEYYALKSEEIAKSNNHYRALSHIYNNIGVIYKRRKENDIAVEYFKKSIQANLEASANNYLGYRNLIIILMTEKKCNEALQYQKKYEKSIIDLENIEEEINRAQTRSHIYICLEMYDSAHYYLFQAMKWKDSLHSVNNNKAVAEMETKYETEKKEQQIKAQELKNQLTQQKLNATGTVAFVLLLGGIIISVLFVKNKRKNVLLEEQKEEIETQNQELTTNNEEILAQKEVIQVANKKLETANKDLETANAEITWLKRSLEHDLKNDLSAMRDVAEVNISKLKSQEEFNDIENKQSRLLATVDYYAFMTKISKEKKDVKDLLFYLVTNLLRKYSKEGAIKVDTESNLDVNKELDRYTTHKIVHCIVELVRNTLKYAFPPDFSEKFDRKPIINLEVMKENEQFFMRYKDNGIGMQKEDKGEGFELLKEYSHPEDFVWKNGEEEGVFVQLRLRIEKSSEQNKQDND